MKFYTRKENIQAVKIESIQGSTLNGEYDLDRTFVSQYDFRLGDYVSFKDGQPDLVWRKSAFESAFDISEDVDEDDLDEYLDEEDLGEDEDPDAELD